MGQVAAQSRSGQWGGGSRAGKCRRVPVACMQIRITETSSRYGDTLGAHVSSAGEEEEESYDEMVAAAEAEVMREQRATAVVDESYFYDDDDGGDDGDAEDSSDSGDGCVDERAECGGTKRARTKLIIYVRGGSVE